MLWIVTIIISIVLITSGILVMLGFGQIKISGPIYTEIIRGKDLIADILPPPEYIIESYLSVLVISNSNDEKEIETNIKKINTLKNDFITRHNYWDKELPQGKMKEILLVSSYQPAMKFYETFETTFLPSLKSKDKQKMFESMSILKEQYQLHRLQIDQLVTLANEYASQNEQKAAKSVQIWMSLIFGFVIFGIVIAFLLNLFLSKSINKTINVLNNEFDLIFTNVEKGNLKIRTNEQLLSPEFRPIATKINSILALFNKTFDKINFVVKEIAAGRTPEKL